MTESESTPGTPAGPSSPDAREREANQWGMFVHFGILAGFVVPFAGLVLPIVLWQLKKDELPRVDAHGKIVVNWMLSSLIYGLVCAVLTLILIGTLGFIALGVATIVFSIVGGIKANDGEVWEYPASIRFLK